MKALLTVFLVVLVAVCIDVGVLYYTATSGRRLPFRLKLMPEVGA